MYFYQKKKFNFQFRTDELCDLWFIYKSYISIEKEKINGAHYYIIVITFNNNRAKKLLFIKE